MQCLNAVMEHVLKSEHSMFGVATANAKRQLALTQSQLVQNEQLQASLEKRMLGALDSPDNKLNQTALLLSMTLFKRDQISSLRMSVLEQTAALEPPLTQPAALIEPVYALESGVLPKKLPALLGGVFGGLVMGGWCILCDEAGLRGVADILYSRKSISEEIDFFS